MLCARETFCVALRVTLALLLLHTHRQRSPSLILQTITVLAAPTPTRTRKVILHILKGSKQGACPYTEGNTTPHNTPPKGRSRRNKPTPHTHQQTTKACQVRKRRVQPTNQKPSSLTVRLLEARARAAAAELFGLGAARVGHQ
jgi:hypothetical protein